MFAKFAFFTVFFLGLAWHAQGHAIITPALGVNGVGTRNDVQRPTNATMCGKVNITATIGTSGTIALSASGIFSANITNFNGSVSALSTHFGS